MLLPGFHCADWLITFSIIMNNPNGSHKTWPSVASSDYAEVQQKNNPPIRNVQSSDREEAEAGIKVCHLTLKSHS